MTREKTPKGLLADHLDANRSRNRPGHSAVLEVDARLRAIDELLGYIADGRVDLVVGLFGAQGLCRHAQRWLKAVA